MSGKIQRRGTLAEGFVPNFYTLSKAQRTDAGTSFTMSFPRSLRGGETIVLVALSCFFAPGTVSGTATATVTGRAMAGVQSPAGPTGASCNVYILKGVAGDETITVSTTAASDANHFFSAVAIVVNPAVYSQTQNGTHASGVVNPLPGNAVITFPTSPANGLAVMGVYSAQTGNISSGGVPNITSGADASITILSGSSGAGLSWGIGLAVSLSTGTFGLGVVGGLTDRAQYALSTYNHL